MLLGSFYNVSLVQCLAGVLPLAPWGSNWESLGGVLGGPKV